MSGSAMNFNVGVMGHVDSGKTTLSKRLSTVASTASFDKNPQSKERGITIDLGFSSFSVDVSDPINQYLNESNIKKIQYTLVDCPGHASLIRAIIGGAQIIDLMILVIDISKGFQTQTSECLIIGQITCSRMIVVLNKVDLILPEKRQSVIEKMTKKVSKTLERTCFSGCPIVPVAAAPGGLENGDINPFGIDELINVLMSQTYVPKRVTNEPFVFAIDHCFSIKGQGTIMTGTVLSGQVCLNNTIEIPVLKIVKKVKSMQMFRKAVEKAVQGDRVGICVTQFDPKQLERGLVCDPGVLLTIHAAVISIHKIPFYKGELRTKSKFHITIGHETVMAKLTLFSKAVDDYNSDKLSAFSDISFFKKGPEQTFNYGNDYLYEEVHRCDEGRDNERLSEYYALLELEKPVTCPKKCLVIGSKLDTDIHANMCRIAFCGRLQSGMTSADYAKVDLPSLKVYKIKQKIGFVDRVHDDYTVIVKDLFKKETNISIFVGLRVSFSSGESGIIEGSFGKSGKITVRIPDGVKDTTKAQYALSSKKRSKGTKTEISGEPDSVKQDEPIKVFITFKRYVYDQSKKLVQS